MNRSLCLAALACLVFSCQISAADAWKFIVTGDGRAGKNRPEDHNGVNTLIMGELAQAIVSEKPKVLLFSGDLIAGPKTDVEMESQLKTWLDVMKPVYDAGIKVYNIRGNHEMHSPHPDAVWRKLFVGPYALPANGPKGEEEMSYSATYENALFIGLDEFQSDQISVNQAWLDETLRSNKATHVFAFAHKMAFRSGNHDDGFETEPAARDKFVNSLISGGARCVFFGHDHLYDHKAFLAPNAKPEQAIHQFVIGTAGAPLVHGTADTGNNGTWKVTPIAHIEGKYGYAVVEVDGKKVTVTFKCRTSAGVFEVADTYSYVVP